MVVSASSKREVKLLWWDLNYWGRSGSCWENNDLIQNASMVEVSCSNRFIAGQLQGATGWKIGGRCWVFDEMIREFPGRMFLQPSCQRGLCACATNNYVESHLPFVKTSDCGGLGLSWCFHRMILKERLISQTLRETCCLKHLKSLLWLQGRTWNPKALLRRRGDSPDGFG